MIRGLHHLSGLHPAFIDGARLALEVMDERGLQPICTEGRRSFERQAQLYAQGRSTPGKIVTKAPAGHSAHNWGLAIDVTVMKGYNSAEQREVQKVFQELGFFTISWDLPHGEHPGFMPWLRRYR